MSQPVPEETNAAEELTEAPPGEHDSDLPDGTDEESAAKEEQEENAETSQDQPSQ